MIWRRQLFDFACMHGGVTKVKDDDVVMFTESFLQARLIVVYIGDAVRLFLSKLRSKWGGSCRILANFSQRHGEG